MNLRWVLIPLLALVCSCAEVVEQGPASGPVIEVDGEQVRHGIWVELFDDGTRKSHGRFTRGIPTGLHRTWHANGQPASERRYDWEGRMHEKQVDFDEQGEVISKRFYKNGEEEVDEASEDDAEGEEKAEGEEGADVAPDVEE